MTFQVTTLAVGEESSTTDAIGEEDPYTTDAYGEEDPTTSFRVGEEDGGGPYYPEAQSMSPFGAY
ncbi:MAG TPA: hypothetical protein VJT67_08310 [Longimicrobiaceae bacterium]|nr:hypothetical protein [Longimicrobiaceae bacterium]